MALTEEVEKPTLFNVNTKEIDPYWIDDKQPLRVPENPLHFEAHKLQLLLARLEKQAHTNPAQFNSTNYVTTLDRFKKLCDEINTGVKADNEILDSGNVASVGNTSPAPRMGEISPTVVDTGIPTDHPFAR